MENSKSSTDLQLEDDMSKQQQRNQSLTSSKHDLYLCGGDPARPPLQVPVHLFANTSNSDTKSIDDRNITQHFVTQTDSSIYGHDDVVTESEVTDVVVDTSEMPQLLRSIAQSSNQQQHIITIIQDSNEENKLQEEDSVSKEMLRRFVIDADGIHPSISSIDERDSPTEMFRNEIREMSSMADFDSEKQQVVIFSDENSCMPGESDNLCISDESGNLQNCENEPQELTIMIGNVDTMGVSEDSPVADFVPDKIIFDSDQHIADNIPLNMNFEVVTEISTQDGEIVRREITTQTYPQKVPKQSRKRKLSTKTGGNADNNTPVSDAISENNKISTSSEERRFKCTKCNLKFLSENVRDIHARCHQDLSKQYKCYFCHLTFPQWSKTYHHLFEHGIEKPHKCTKCAFTCINKCDLTAHSTVHSNSKEYNCIKCGRAFKHRRNMMAHCKACPGLDKSGNIRVCQPEEKYICDVCNRQLSSKKSLEKHMEIHLDVRPFVCNECGHSTRLKESLLLHKRTHTGEKPFKCDICEYATPDKSSLRRHKRRHNNDKPYKCQHCNYKCIQKHCLDTHIRRKHTGEQFVCGLCHYATHDRYGLNQHFKRHQNPDGTLMQEIPPEDAEGKTQGIVSIAQPSDNNMPTHTYIALPSGAVLSSTEIGKNIVVEEATKKLLLQQNAGSPVVFQIRHDIQQSEIIKKTDIGKGVQQQQDLNQISIQADKNLSDNNNKEETRTIELGPLEANLIQQIQQPGDEIFIQNTGEIVIRRQDGHLLVIQQQEIDADEMTTVDQDNNQEFLPTMSPAELSEK